MLINIVEERQVVVGELWVAARRSQTNSFYLNEPISVGAPLLSVRSLFPISYSIAVTYHYSSDVD